MHCYLPCTKLKDYFVLKAELTMTAQEWELILVSDSLETSKSLSLQLPQGDLLRISSDG